MKLNRVTHVLAVVFVLCIGQQDALKARDFSFDVHLIFEWGHHLVNALKSLKNISDALKVQNGPYMINQTFYDDLISSCNELEAIDRGYSFFNATGFCPNITDSLIVVASTAKASTDVLLQIVSAGLTVSANVNGCKDESNITKIFCYVNNVAPAIKDVKMIVFSFKQYLTLIQGMVRNVKLEMDYCRNDFSKLPPDQQKVIIEQWHDAFMSNQTDSCQTRAQAIMGRRENSTENGPSTDTPRSTTTDKHDTPPSNGTTGWSTTLSPSITSSIAVTNAPDAGH